MTDEEKAAQEKAAKLLDKRQEACDSLEALVDVVKSENRDFTVEETETRTRLTSEIDSIDESLTAKMEKAERTRKAAEFRKAFGMTDDGPNNPGGGVSVTFEHRTYERGNGNSYFMDLFKMGAGAGCDGFGQAAARLRQHAKEIAVDAEAFQGSRSFDHGHTYRSAAEEYFVRQVIEGINPRKSGQEPGTGYFQRDLSTAAGSGGEFVPPIYLTEQYVPLARAARVFADAQSKMQLPPGTMSINIPKVYGGTTVAVQGTQNTNVSDTDLETEYVTFPVVTVAGAQVLSLQLLERSPIAFDDVVMKDLALAQAAYLDQQCISGTGSGGQMTGVYNTTGINTVTWTQASPTIKGLYGQMAYAKSLIANARFLPATHIFFTPTRWEWIEQQVDSNNRPLVLPAQNGPWNVMQVSPDMATAEGLTGGRMLSCAVTQDFNIPQTVSSNQDIVIIQKADDNYLYESPLITRALPQTYGAQLSVLLQLYGYAAFTAARYPVSNTVITGTGLVNTGSIFNS
jgi:HK97 family phage major capsid protein